MQGYVRVSPAGSTVALVGEHQREGATQLARVKAPGARAQGQCRSLTSDSAGQGASRVLPGCRRPAANARSGCARESMTALAHSRRARIGAADRCCSSSRCGACDLDRAAVPRRARDADPHQHGRRASSRNDLNNINGLNHYIGMKRDRARRDPELRIMPWIVGGAHRWRAGGGRAGQAAAAVRLARRRSSRSALVGLVDFWRWEYDYGHDLDFEHAIIKIPGMTYQPPLIGDEAAAQLSRVSSAGGRRDPGRRGNRACWLPSVLRVA